MASSQQPGAGTGAAPRPVVPPTPIIEMNFAFAQSAILMTAIELNIFTLIAQGATTGEQIAEQAALARPALQRFLDALCALKLLSREQDEYQLTPISELYLVRGKPSYLGDTALQTRQEWDAWIHLPDVIRSGESVRRIDASPLGGPFNAPLAEYLFPVVYPVMKRVCQRLEVGSRLTGLQVADLGAGTAPGAIAALEYDPQARAVALDFAEVLDRARPYAERHGVLDRLTLQEADLATTTLPAGQFDLIFLGHVCRVVGADVTRHLFHQGYQALKPGGHLVVVESYKDPDNFDKLFPHIISLNMLVNTGSGDAYSIEQFQHWLHAEQFRVEPLFGVAPDPVLIATR